MAIMKSLIIFSCALAVVISEQYSSKYDNTDYKEIMNNDRLLENYVKCLMDQGPCTPDGKELKSHMHGALETGCEHCTEKQIEAVEYCINVLVRKHSETWNQLCEKYDPERKWRKKYEDKAREHDIEFP